MFDVRIFPFFLYDAYPTQPHLRPLQYCADIVTGDSQRPLLPSAPKSSSTSLPTPPKPGTVASKIKTTATYHQLRAADVSDPAQAESVDIFLQSLVWNSTQLHFKWRNCVHHILFLQQVYVFPVLDKIRCWIGYRLRRPALCSSHGYYGITNQPFVIVGLVIPDLGFSLKLLEAGEAESERLRQSNEARVFVCVSPVDRYQASRAYLQIRQLLVILVALTMGTNLAESSRSRSIEIRDRDHSPVRDLEEKERRSKHRSSKSSRKKEKDHRSKDRERSKEREREGNDREKDRSSTKDKRSERDYDVEKYKDKRSERDKDCKDRGKERDRDRDRDRDRETENDEERANKRSKDREKRRQKEREVAKYKDGDRESKIDKDRDRVREKGKGRREKERELDQDKEKSREREKVGRKQQEGHDRGKDGRKVDVFNVDRESGQNGDIGNQRKSSHHVEDETRSSKYQQSTAGQSGGSHVRASEVEEHISKMKEERLQKKSEGVSEVLTWVNRSHKIEEKKNSEKEKALQLSQIFEEQNNINQGELEDEGVAQHAAQDLAGVKVLHGFDKVIEGGTVVLTLKDQSILSNGDINEEMDMLENVEIGEQKQRDEAYKAAKKKAGSYVDKFSDEPGSERKILPQYDDSIVDEGVTLDASGCFTSDTEKELEKLRKRIHGVSANNHFEDLNTSDKITSSDYYTREEMVQFKKTKKKKSLRKKEKINIDALEAEAVSAGLGVGDLGTRKDGKRNAIREEKERLKAEMRSNAYQAAYAKADEASQALQLEQTRTIRTEEYDDNPVFGDDDDLHKSLERARKLALKKQGEEAASCPQAIALLAASTASHSTVDDQSASSGERQKNKVVFTEMQEFLWVLELDEEVHKSDGEDVFMEEDIEPKALDQETKDEDGGWIEVKDTDKEEHTAYEDKEEMLKDQGMLKETIRETAIGRGLSGALKLLKDQGMLKETVEWGGRNMDKKKSKLVGIYENDGQKEIRIERMDEFGRNLTPKEAFRLSSHKFHGKGPGKRKQEKRTREYQKEMKVMQMKNSDTPSQSVERMREAQACLKTPYLVLSGHVKPGQTSDPSSGFATVEKDLPGGLTPMLGNRKVEHVLGIKRKAEPGDMGQPKKPKTSFKDFCLEALDIVVSEDKKYKIRLILCLTNNWEAYGGRPQHVKWGKAAGWNLTSVDDFYTDPTLKSYYKTYLKDFAEDFRCRHPICQALEVAGDLAASKTRLLLAPNTPNKKSKTEGYMTETSSTQENTSNPAAKDNVDNMSDDETDVPNKKNTN
ncbi:hypothetical protein Vadar_022063 [Vaccinium darrowii]|uniref:Uncharacterized protein n=1 Tax=Vaccinium darrowii TaxID=229202 RepID=A0ACB7X2N5_9ERIC|nr:hypothetical protein Vadar_022063 [Vaccinium darrowii]